MCVCMCVCMCYVCGECACVCGCVCMCYVCGECACVVYICSRYHFLSSNSNKKVSLVNDHVGAMQKTVQDPDFNTEKVLWSYL